MQLLNMEINKENGKLITWAKHASGFAKVVNIHLKGGIISNEIEEGFNSQTMDLEPPEYQRPDFHILKMLLAAGAEIEETDMFTSEICLKIIVRNYIRDHLKKIHPKSNLYITIKKLTSLPKILQTYLLYDTQLGKNKFLEMTTDERELFSQTSEKEEPMIQRLICRGVDVNIKNEKGMTPLMVASQNGDDQLIKKLLDAGADMNCSNSVTGDTSLILASEKGQTTCVQKLLDYHANVNIQGKNGDTAVISAARNGHEECLQVLMNIGANLNIKNNNGNTALIAAVQRFQFQCAVQLIKDGADVNLMDNQGNTTLILAARKGQQNFVKELITAGANLNHFDEHQRVTALMTAAFQGHTSCMNLLIQSAADLNIPDVNGKTALMRTAELVSSDTCFSLLLKTGAQIDMTILAEAASKVMQKAGKEEKQNSASCRLSTGILFLLWPKRKRTKKNYLSVEDDRSVDTNEEIATNNSQKLSSQDENLDKKSSEREIKSTQATKSVSEGATLSLKPRVKVNRNPYQWYQCTLKIKKKKRRKKKERKGNQYTKNKANLKFRCAHY